MGSTIWDLPFSLMLGLKFVSNLIHTPTLWNDVCPVIFDKMLLSNSSIINSVKHMLQNSESATKRCSIIVSHVL